MPKEPKFGEQTVHIGIRVPASWKRLIEDLYGSPTEFILSIPSFRGFSLFLYNDYRHGRLTASFQSPVLGVFLCFERQ